MSNQREYFTIYEGKKIGLMPPFKNEYSFSSDKSIQNSFKSNVLKTIAGDKKSLLSSNVTPSSYIIPAVNSVLLPKNQGSYGSCGPHAYSYALELLHYKKTGRYMQFSTDFLFGCSNVFDDCFYDSSGTDSGTAEEELMQKLMRYGDVPLSELNGYGTVEKSKSAIQTNPSKYLEAARPYRVSGGYSASTQEEMKSILSAGQPIVVSIDITGQDNTNRIFYVDEHKYVGGHFLCVVGYNERGWLAFNSWDTDKSKAIWTIDYKVKIKTSVVLMDSTPEDNRNDFNRLTKDSWKITTLNGERRIYGASKKQAEYIMYLLNLGNTRYQETALTPSASFNSDTQENSWPLPIKPYQDMGASSDIGTSYQMGNALGINVDGFILARNDDFVACSAGAVLCAPGNYTKRRYPLFLTDGSSVDSRIDYYNDVSTHRIGLKKAEILAGPAIISDSVLNNIHCNSKERIYGEDRIGTAIEIAKHCTGNTIILVNMDDFPDLVCAGALGAQMNAAVLINNSSDKLSMQNRNFLFNFGPRKIIIIGGTSLISSAVESILRDITSNVERIYGSDRYDTSVQIIKQYWQNYNYDNIVLAKGDAFKNMSSAAMLAANLNAPVLLTDGSSLSNEARSIINNLKSKNVVTPVILGSPSGAISSSLLATI